jgi:DNA-binding transcriptional LysR family regulator
MREADLAIRMQAPRQPDLIQRHLVTIGMHVYASPEYLKRFGTPEKPEDLDNHRLISFGEEIRAPISNINWLLEAGATKERRPILQINSSYGIYRAAVSGLGIAGLPDYMAREGANLVRILPELSGPSIETYFVYPEELRASKRISVFRDFLIRKVHEHALA